jgi:multiple sugar transport system permease protein
MASAEAQAWAAAATPERRRARRRARWRRRRLVLLLMSPWIVGFAVFFGYPLVMNLYLSFTHYDLLSPPRWIGFANYTYLFSKDPQVWTAIKNTLWVIAIMVPLQVLFAFGIALLLARARSGVGIFRTIFYLPALAPPVAATLGFVFILNPGTGPVNVILSHLGIQGPLWFQDPSWSKPALTMLALWGIGNTMVIFLAAVLDVPRTLYESAQLDGAGPLQRLLYVTLPSISPVILFSAIYGVIQGLQYFTQAYVAAGVAAGQASQAADVTSVNLGYPKDSTLFYPVLLYQHGFNDFQMGYASAIAMILLIVSFAFTLAIVLNSRRWVHAGGAR